MEKLSVLKNISAFTFHFDIPVGRIWSEISNSEKISLVRVYTDFFKKLKIRFPEAVLTLENILTPVQALDEVVAAAGIYYCIDIGHLLKEGFDISEISDRLPLTKVIHLHGCQQKSGKPADHREVEYLRNVFQLLEKFKGTLTVENYHARMLDDSLKVINEYF